MQPIFITKDLWELVTEGYDFLLMKNIKHWMLLGKQIFKGTYKER
jgi:hypothetical protein